MSQQTGGSGGGGGTGTQTPDRVEGYAAALFDAARGEGLVDRVVNELFHFARAYERNDTLRQTLTAAEIPVEKRQGIVEELLGERASPLTASLVSFIVGSGRAKDLVAIIDRLNDRAAKEHQREVAEVRSAIPLEGDQKERLAKALASALDTQVEVKVIVDPSVMGGLIVKVGDTVLDGSVRHRLDKLREVL